MPQLHQKLVKLGKGGFPSSACIEVTYRCNAGCDYCYIDHTVPVSELDSADYAKILAKLRNEGILFLLITGGEAFTRPDILEILQSAIDNDFFEINIFTNGTVLTEEHLVFLEENASRITTMQMSVFSHIASDNDAYLKVPGATDKIIKNAMRLKKAGIIIRLALSPMRFSVDCISQTMDYYEKLGLYVSFSPYRSPAAIENVTEYEFSTSYAFFLRMFSSLRESDSRKLAALLRQKCNQKKDRTDLCGGRYSIVTINPKGDLSGCIPFRNLSLGNILSPQSLHDLLQESADYQRIRCARFCDMNECTVCQFQNFCSICAGRQHTLFGKATKLDKQLCNFAHALHDFACTKGWW